MCDNVKSQNKVEKLNVILDTDIGNDVDDALAIDMLYKYIKHGRVNLLAISNVKSDPFAVPYLDIINRWYGYPKIPLVTIKPISNEKAKKKRFTQVVVELKENDKYVFKRKLASENQVAESVEGLREILSKQPDNSVVFISLGYLTNLSNLLSSLPDKHSALNGVDLIRKKVKFLSMMGGDFRGVERTEFNIRYDVSAAQNVFKKWPTDIYISPYELGSEILFPAKTIETQFKYVKHHPLVISYENYLKMPYDRQSWDLTSVLFAIEGDKYFKLSPRGNVEVIGKGKTMFTEDKVGKHIYLKTNKSQQEKILERLIEIVVEKPKKYQ